MKLITLKRRIAKIAKPILMCSRGDISGLLEQQCDSILKEEELESKTFPLELPRGNSSTVGKDVMPPLSFLSEATEFIGRDAEMASLREFADDSNPDHTLLWWQLAGAGGEGKSRLALQFAQTLDKEGWHAGFLNKRQLEDINWCKEHLPSRTFIIVDYVAEESKASNFADMIRSLSMRKDLSRLKAVRVLALEREPYQLSVDASKGSVALKNWLTPALNHDQKGHALRTHAFRKRKDSKDSGSEPSEALELDELTEKAMTDIVASWRLYREKSPLDENDKKRLLDRLRRLSSNQVGASGRSEAWRPLFAMLMAEAFDCDRHEFSIMTIEGLLDNFLESEQASWPGKPDSLTESQRLGRTFAMISTVCGGLDWKKLFEAIEPHKSIEKALKIKKYEVSEVDKWARRYVGQNVRSTPPLKHPLEPRTPDLLGEYFVLKTIAEGATSGFIEGSDEAEVVINAAVRLDCNGMIEFMLRAQQDFSSHEGLKRLRGALNDPSVPLQMFHAAELGFLNLLNKRLSKSTKAKDRNYALLVAAKNGHADCVKALLDKGADPDAAYSEYGIFPLLLAAQNGHADCVKALLDKEADPDAVDSESGLFPLLVAALNGHADCVKALLDKGADPNAAHSEDGGFPLLLAAEGGHADCVKALLDKRADPDAVSSKTGNFPLLLAAEGGHADCVKALLAKEADPDAANSENGSFPLLVAAFNGHTDCVRALLAKEANPDAVSGEDGDFPLLLAAQNGHADCVRALLDKEADPDAVSSKDGAFPLLVVALNGHADCARALLDKGADPNAVHSKDGYFPLLVAAQYGHADCVRALLDEGADPNAVHSKDGYFPLLVAARYGYADCVRALLDKGADPNAAHSNGDFPLKLAAQNGHAGCVKALLDAKANPSAVHMKSMCSSLLLAMQKGHTKVVALLLWAAMRRNRSICPEAHYL